jgi:hypothetical protein
MGYTSITCMISEDVNKGMYVLLQSFVYVYASKTTPINEIKLLQNLHRPDNLKRIKWAMKYELNLWLGLRLMENPWQPNYRTQGFVNKSLIEEN